MGFCNHSPRPKGNLSGMKRALNAIKHHISVEPTKSLAFQNRFCPKAKDSWCYLQRDEASETHSHHKAVRLPHAFMQELSPIFDRLSNEDLLKRCLLGLTQNQTDSLNGTLWTLIFKTLVLGKTQVTIGVCGQLLSYLLKRCLLGLTQNQMMA